MIFPSIHQRGASGMRIAELPREQFEGYELVFSYDSKAY